METMLNEFDENPHHCSKGGDRKRKRKGYNARIRNSPRLMLRLMLKLIKLCSRPSNNV